MGIAPSTGGGAAPIVTTGTFYVDAAADSGGDGSRGAPYNDLQLACNDAYAANQATPDTIAALLVLPGTYQMRYEAVPSTLNFSNGSLEIDNFTVRSTGGAEATTIVSVPGLTLTTAVLRENALLDGFTLTPDTAAVCLAFADSGPPQSSTGRRSVARNIIFDAEPLSPLLGGACVIVSQLASGQPKDNALESFKVRGEWDSGIAFNDEGGILYIRDGIIDRACRFDFSVFYAGAGGFGGAQNPPARMYVENVHLPSEVTITDDCFFVDDEGELYLQDVSVDGAGQHGIYGEDTGKIFGDGITVINSVGDDVHLIGSAKITVSSILALTVSAVAASNIVVMTDRAGTATVLNTASNVVVAVGIGFDGKRVTATLAEADGAIAVASAVWDGAGNLTIATTAAVTADRDVDYVVHSSAPA